MFFLSVWVGAQDTSMKMATTTSISMPKMPEISASLSMPKVSAPVMGVNFYTPEFNSVPNKNASNASADAEKNAIRLKTVSANVTDSSTATDSLNVADMLQAFKVGGVGSLQNELFEDSSFSSELLSLSAKDLFELKNVNASLNESSTKKPSILRFFINGNDILDSLKTVYFSDKEADGSFLLTADRKYMLSKKPRSETFYVLFKADGNSLSHKGYNVEATIVQDAKNENSLLYRFAEKQNLKAQKTGNLVSLYSTSKDMNVDMLLDIR